MLRCTSAQQASLSVDWGMPVYFFLEVWHAESSLATSDKVLLTDLWNNLKRFTFFSLIYSVFQRYLDTRDICPMIEMIAAFQKFPFQLWSSLAGGGRMCSSNILPRLIPVSVEELRFNYGWNKSNAKRSNPELSSKVQTLIIIDVAKTFLRDRAAR